VLSIEQSSQNYSLCKNIYHKASSKYFNNVTKKIINPSENVAFNLDLIENTPKNEFENIYIYIY
jgi:hypothetical protein